MKPRPTLRLKLVLAALPLLALPWAGWHAVQEMERFLLEAQQQALLATARAVATALHERPQLLRVRTAPPAAARGGRRLRLEEAAAQAERSGQPVVVEEIGAEPQTAEAQAVAEIAAILRGLERATARIAVINRELRLLALSGRLAPQAEAEAGTHAWRALFDRLSPAPAPDAAAPAGPPAGGRELTRALLGAPATGLRTEGGFTLVSAAHPIWSRDEVIGAVLVEETTHSILAVRSQALEGLLMTTLVVFALAATLLLGFATRLSSRIRRLRDEAEDAVDARGRIRHLTTASRAGDEIGDLSRSFSAVLEKLAQHHAYLERLAGRLSHELRTPIAVVRSSLENLRLERDAVQREVYLGRAEQGLARLSKILTRMSEARRLEQGLGGEARVRFDAAAVTGECVKGYRLAYPGRDFVLTLPGRPLELNGSPDLFAQLLDKLVANAADFATPGTPVVITLAQEGQSAQLTVSNAGAPIPEEVRARLFGSMISARPERAGEEPHLGLGLYVARLIAEFHGGTIAAENHADGSGVSLRLTFPLA